MFSKRRMNLFVVLLVSVLNGIEACFRSNIHENISLTTGIPYYKECQCTEPGYTADNLRWLNKYGVAIGPEGPGTKIYTEEQTDGLSLFIPIVTETISGTYKCETLVNGHTYTQSYTIVATEPIYFYKTPTDQHLVYGQTSAIMCQPISTTKVITKWYKENEEEVIQITDDEKYVVQKNRLVIHNVTDKDAGHYKCTAQAATTNEDVDKYIEVQVVTMPVIKEMKANSDTYPIKVVAGMNLTIECIADGTPHPEYYWNKTSSVDNEESGNITYRQEINTIIFEEIKPEDTGVYTCHAYNLAGTTEMRTFVEVLIPPSILDFPNITDVEGATIKTVCNATGKPEPVVIITYAGRDLNVDLNVTDPQSSPITDVIMLDRSNEGIYVCEASNAAGSVEAAMYLTVLHRPYFEVEGETIWGWEGKTINMNCEQDSNPVADVTWRFHGNNIQTQKEVEINKQLLATLNNMPEPYFTFTVGHETAYGIYECIATNSYGKATKLITLVQAFRPGSVKNVTTEDLTATSITYEIQGPDHVDGPPVIGFTATYDEAKNYNITDIHINRTWALGRPFKLEKLKPNTTYHVRIAAVNEVGAGEWSDYYEFRTLEKSVPEAPVWNADPIILGQNSHILKWGAPNDNGEPIEYYILRYCPEEDEESCKEKQIPPTTELELVDLEFNTTYFLELVAHNAEGDSMPVNITVLVPAPLSGSATTLLSGGAIIGISIVIVVLCLLLLDVLLLVWRRQGIIATCCYKKDSKRKEKDLTSRDKKGLLTNGESEDRTNSRNNDHKEFQYNKNTGVVTGKHSEV